MATKPIMKKIIRTSTIPLSLKTFCLDLFDELHSRYHLLAVTSPGTELEAIANRGTEFKAVRMERQISLIADVWSLISLVRLFRKERPQMVHSITPKAGLLSMLAAWIVGVPVRLHSFTGLVSPTATGIKRLVLLTTDRVTCACATHIQAEGFGIRSDLLRYGITKKHVTVLHNGNLRGINLDYYRVDPEVAEKGMSIRKKYGLSPDIFTFIFVGRVVKDKGITELIEAYRRLRVEGRNVSLLLVGIEEKDHPLPPDTRQRIFDDPTIHFTEEWVDDVRPYYEVADALVLPSYREGFPNVVLEAGALSLPSIVTDVNGSREIIEDGTNGIVVPAHDPVALYSAMKKMLDNRDDLAKMGAMAKAMIEEKFDSRDVMDALLRYYSDIMNHL